MVGPKQQLTQRLENQVGGACHLATAGTCSKPGGGTSLDKLLTVLRQVQRIIEKTWIHVVNHEHWWTST